MMLTKDQLREELETQAGPDGALTAGVLGALVARGPWEGRVWEVFELCARDWERLSYLAGGVLPAEVATWVGFWVDADLTLEQIGRVIAAGGYDPEPFSVLARHGRLDVALGDGSGAVRRVDGELAGAWISDQFADAGDREVLAWADSLDPGGDRAAG